MLLAETDLPLDILTGVLVVCNLLLALGAVVTLWSSAKVLDQAKVQTEALKRAATAQTQAIAAAMRPIIAPIPQDQVTDVDAVEDDTFQPRRDEHVIVEPLDMPGKKRIRVTVPIRNIGPGPAFLTKACLRGSKSEIKLLWPTGVLRTGDSTCLWQVEPEDDDMYAALVEAVSSPFSVDVSYEDAVHRQASHTRIQVGRYARGLYFAPSGCEIECKDAEEEIRILGESDLKLTPPPS